MTEIEVKDPVMTPSMQSLFEVLETKYGYDRADLDEMLAFMQAGGTYGEFFGYSDEIYNAMEEIALAHYRGQRYDTALSVFNYIRNLSHDTRLSALRGAGACHQATKDFNTAVSVYRLALARAPTDLLSQVFCGESLCLAGDVPAGVQLLEQAVADADKHPAKLQPYLARARAILEAQRGRPQNTHAPISASAVAPAAVVSGKPKADEPLDVPAMLANNTPESVDSVLQDPAVRAQIEALGDGYREGFVTLREIAGFTDEQFDGGYAAACKYLEAGKPVDALQLVGWLLWLDPRQARLYQLGGLATHHLKLWCLADYLYGQALRFEANNGITLIYQGECRLMMDERKEGLDLVRQGLAIGPQGNEGPDVARRAQVLLKQFGGEQETK